MAKAVVFGLANVTPSATDVTFTYNVYYAGTDVPDTPHFDNFDVVVQWASLPVLMDTVITVACGDRAVELGFNRPLVNQTLLYMWDKR